MSWTSSVGRPVLAGVAAVTLAGCSALTPGEERDEGAGPDPDRSVSTELPDEDVTLRLAFTDGPEMVQELVAAFEEEHPQVTIEPEHTEFSDYETSVKLMMTSDSPPDIAQHTIHSKDLIATGHLLDLDPYGDAYGWSETFPENTLEPLTLDADGRTHGTGYLYGVPAGMSLSGIFYNRALADEVGVELPPADLDAFEDALEQARDADVEPLYVGALDSGGLHLWTELLNSMMPPESYGAWVNGEPDGDLTGDDAVAATEKLVDWAERGLVNDSASGLGQADSTARFATGGSLFLINGNWAAGQVDAELGEDAGFFPLPGNGPDHPPAASGSSVAYNVSAGTDHPDAAAAFLDFLGSAEAAEIVSDAGFEPPDSDLVPEPDGVRGDIQRGYAEIVEAEGLHLYPDFSAPAAYNAIVTGIQRLIAGDVEPAEYLSEVQGIRDDYQAE